MNFAQYCGVQETRGEARVISPERRLSVSAESALRFRLESLLRFLYFPQVRFSRRFQGCERAIASGPGGLRERLDAAGAHELFAAGRVRVDLRTSGPFGTFLLVLSDQRWNSARLRKDRSRLCERKNPRSLLPNPRGQQKFSYRELRQNLVKQTAFVPA